MPAVVPARSLVNREIVTVTSWAGKFALFFTGLQLVQEVQN